MREIKFEYGFLGTNGVIKKVYALSEIQRISEKCDLWNEVPICYLRQLTGLKDNNKRDVCEQDIYSETDQGRKMLFIVTWINEYAAFAMLTPLEFKEYKKIGVEVIEKSFEGFYVQLHRESFQKMKYEGNIYENPELLS